MTAACSLLTHPAKTRRRNYSGARGGFIGQRSPGRDLEARCLPDPGAPGASLWGTILDRAPTLSKAVWLSMDRVLATDGVGKGPTLGSITRSKAASRTEAAPEHASSDGLGPRTHAQRPRGS